MKYLEAYISAVGAKLPDLKARLNDGAVSEVKLPAGFWQERYKAECVAVSRLAREKPEETANKMGEYVTLRACGCQSKSG